MADDALGVELELTRTPDDRRRYVVAGLGSLRLEGFSKRRADAEAGGRRWTFRRPGLFGRRVEATDEHGELVGEYRPRTLRRGGAMDWRGAALAFRPSSSWRTRYDVCAGDRVLGSFDGRGWGRRPVRVRLDPEAAIDPGLVLFCAFVVHGIAGDDAAAVAAVS